MTCGDFTQSRNRDESTNFKHQKTKGTGFQKRSDDLPSNPNWDLREP